MIISSSYKYLNAFDSAFNICGCYMKHSVVILGFSFMILNIIDQLTEQRRAELNTQEKVIGRFAVSVNNSDKSVNGDR